MFVGTLAIVVGLAAGATAFWALYEKRVPMMSMLAGVLWLYAGFNAFEVKHGEAVVIAEETPVLQYIFYFLAGLNFLLLLFWLWSEPEDRQDLLSQI